MCCLILIFVFKLFGVLHITWWVDIFKKEQYSFSQKKNQSIVLKVAEMKVLKFLTIFTVLASPK